MMKAALCFSPGVVALAGDRLERFAVHDADMPAAMADQMVLLKPVRDERHGGPLQAQDLRQHGLRDGDVWTGDPIRHLEEPARHPLLACMQRVAGGHPQTLSRDRFGEVGDQIPDGLALGEDGPEHRRGIDLARPGTCTIALARASQRSESGQKPTAPSRPTLAISTASPLFMTTSSETAPLSGK